MCFKSKVTKLLHIRMWREFSRLGCDICESFDPLNSFVSLRKPLTTVWLPFFSGHKRRYIWYVVSTKLRDIARIKPKKCIVWFKFSPDT